MTRPILKLKTPRRRLDKKRNALHAQEATLIRLFGTEAVKRLKAAQIALDEAMSGKSAGAPSPAKPRGPRGNGQSREPARSAPGREAPTGARPPLDSPGY
jgi:hypothetical protein